MLNKILPMTGVEPRFWKRQLYQLSHNHFPKKLYCLFEKTENKQKEAEVGPFFKKTT